ncbi:hypothetical protein E2C01_086432 [Portunus trituberculatus]|uniref:Uncharacterized protein n=1 Tax=Portunus trituberculatus TaxID=210409 RepID=A0A5B7JDG4_PORTR|nr:hypothetical protein [Portunus trituberculatus]
MSLVLWYRDRTSRPFLR